MQRVVASGGLFVYSNPKVRRLLPSSANMKYLLVMAIVSLVPADRGYAQTCPASNGYIGVPMRVDMPRQTLPVPATNTVKGPISAGSQIGNIQGQSDAKTIFSGCGRASRTFSWLSEVKRPTNVTFQDYAVYPTGIDGIGYILDGRDHRNPSFSPLGTGGSVLIYPFGNQTFFDYDIGSGTRIRFVATSTLNPGTYVIPPQQVGWEKVTGFNTSINSAPSASSAVWINQTTVIVTGGTCNLSAGDENRTINLEPFQLKNVPVSGKFGLKTFPVTANCIGASTASFKFSGHTSQVDGTLFENTGDAQGLGLYVGTPYGAVPANGTDDQRTFSVDASSGIAQLPIEVGYARGAGTVSRGTFLSRVTVTLSYN
jgi:major type 1 subunit fimbrin (pilin)